MGPYSHPHYSEEEKICVEVFVHKLTEVMAAWPPTWERFVHGDKNHPHVWFEVKFDTHHPDYKIVDGKCCCGMLKSQWKMWNDARSILDGIWHRDVQ